MLGRPCDIEYFRTVLAAEHYSLADTSDG